jgi:homocysteine S-methyltransferase
MPRSRDVLPQLGFDIFLTDAGLETDLLFNQGVDLPQFAAFPLVQDSEGKRRLRRYFDDHAAVAVQAGVGFVLEAPTWRASQKWGQLLGYDAGAG